MNLSIYLNTYALNISKQLCNYLLIEYLHVRSLLIIKVMYVVRPRWRYFLHKIE